VTGSLRTTPIWLRITGLGLLALLGWGGLQAWDRLSRAPGDAAPVIEFEVEGLDCAFWCAVKLTDAIDQLDGARVESFDPGKGRVTIRHDPKRQDADQLRAIFETRGYDIIDTHARAGSPRNEDRTRKD